MDLLSLEALAGWLAARSIDTDGWGCGATKGLPTLLAELRAGEARLVDSPPRRELRIVSVLVVRDGMALAELEQELAGGTVRSRLAPPAEKQLPGENPTDAALRCLAEELGVAAQCVTIHEASARFAERTVPSPSYPGLLTHYLICTIEASVDGFPLTLFRTDEATGGPVLRHRWGWVPLEDLRRVGC